MKNLGGRRTAPRELNTLTYLFCDTLRKFCSKKNSCHDIDADNFYRPVGPFLWDSCSIFAISSILADVELHVSSRYSGVRGLWQLVLVA